MGKLRLVRLVYSHSFQAHSQCSEAFYRDQLASDIRTEPSRSAAERKAMLELLKHFEEDGLDDPFAYPEQSDDDDADDLERRLSGIDIGEYYILR